VLSQTEVENFHSPAAIASRYDHDVLGLEVAMHDAMMMGRGKRIGELNARLDEFFGPESPCGQLAAQCSAGH